MKTFTTIIIILIIVAGYLLLRGSAETPEVVTDSSMLTEDQSGLQMGVPAPGTNPAEVDEMIVLSEGGSQTEVDEPQPQSEPEPEPEPQPEPEPRKINVSGNDFSFSPSSLTLQSGERVKITFENVGATPHNLIIEGTSIATKTIPKGKSDVIEFTAPSSGTYTIFCSVAGHRELGMVGTLEVE